MYITHRSEDELKRRAENRKILRKRTGKHLLMHEQLRANESKKIYDSCLQDLTTYNNDVHSKYGDEPKVDA